MNDYTANNYHMASLKNFDVSSLQSNFVLEDPSVRGRVACRSFLAPPPGGWTVGIHTDSDLFVSVLTFTFQRRC